MCCQLLMNVRGQCLFSQEGTAKYPEIVSKRIKATKNGSVSHMC